MKSIRDIVRAFVGLPVQEEGGDLITWAYYKSNQAYVQANTMSKDEVRDMVGVTGSSYYDWSGSFHFSQMVDLTPYEHKEIHWEERRCGWCNRKYFEDEAVCAGCGAPI